MCKCTPTVRSVALRRPYCGVGSCVPPCEEVFKPIPDYEGLYEVSNFGRVRSLFRVVEKISGGHRKVPEKMMRLSEDNKGYLKVQLCIDGIRGTFRVHNLVARTFIGERPEGLYVCHIDGNKHHNAVWNLRYGTKQAIQ